MEGLIGKKIGMTQIFDETGKRVCVTVIEVGPCPVVQVKTLEKDGYVAAQLGFGVQKLWKDPEADKEAHGGRSARNRMTKAESGHLTKTGGLTKGVRILKEYWAGASRPRWPRCSSATSSRRQACGPSPRT